MATHAGTVAGLLLTGGASRRMGRDKALLVVNGQRLVDRAAGVLVAALAGPARGWGEGTGPGAGAGPGANDGALVLEVGPGYSSRAAVREDPPGSGPLAALVAGAGELARLGYEGPVIMLAVDMPFVTVELLRFLAERPGPGTAIPMAGGRAQPLCARYGLDALAAAPGLLAAGERSLRALMAAIEVGWVPESEWLPVGGPEGFSDLDEPGDLDRHGLS